MSDDGLLLQGRQTKRKWKQILFLLSAALLSLGLGWATARPDAIKLAAIHLRQRILPENCDTWADLPQEGRTLAYAGDLLICSGGGQLFCADREGTIRWQRELSWTDPLIRTGWDTAVVYEPGGQRLILAEKTGAREIGIPRGIDLAAVGPEGQCAVITSGSGFLTQTEIFDSTGEHERSVCSTGSAMVMMAFLADGTLASCCLDPECRWVFRLDTPEGNVLEQPLTADLVYDLRPCGDGAGLWTSDGVCFFDASGQQTGSFPLDGDAVVGWDCGDFAALTVRRGAACRLLTVQDDGTAVWSEILPRMPVVLTVCDKYVCLLDRQTLRVYDGSGRLCRNSALGSRAETLFPADGGVLLSGGGQYLYHIIP